MRRSALWFSGLVVAVVVASAAPALFRAAQHGFEAREGRRPASSLGGVRPRPVVRLDAMSELIAANGSKPLRVPVSLRLVGELDAPGTEAASVTVIVGEQQFPAVMNGAAFEADLPGVNPDSMVRLEAVRGTSRYRALLGSALLLKRQAGSDRRLDLAESPSLRISPMSTAIHFFLRDELGGRLPANDDETDAAIQALVPEDLTVAANAIRALGAGEVALPAGRESTDALIANRNAYRGFLNANAGIRSGAQLALQQGRYGAFSAGDLGRDWMLSTRMNRSGVSFVQPVIQLMMRRPGGYAVHTNESRDNPQFDASVTAEGDLSTLPQGTPYADGLIYTNQFDPGTMGPYVHRSTILRETYRRVFVGRAREIWLRVREQHKWFPQYPNEPGTDETTASLWVASDFGAVRKPVVDAQVLGRRALPHFCMKPSGVNGEPARSAMCEMALYTMGANGTGVADYMGNKVDGAMAPIGATGGVAVQWRIADDGTLRMSRDNVEATFWRLGISEGPADAMVYLVTSNIGGQTQTLAGHTIAMDGNLPVFMAATDPVGLWNYSTLIYRNVYAYHADSAAATDTMDRSADGTQVQTTSLWVDYPLTSPADSINRFRSGWQLLGGALYDTRYYADVPTGITLTRYFSSCQQARERGASYCAAFRVRYFRPLSRVGNRWYGLEEVYSRSPATGDVPPFNFERVTRVTYYEKQTP